jgi:hypothetical protein
MGELSIIVSPKPQTRNRIIDIRLTRIRFEQIAQCVKGGCDTDLKKRISPEIKLLGEMRIVQAGHSRFIETLYA